MICAHLNDAYYAVIYRSYGSGGGALDLLTTDYSMRGKGGYAFTGRALIVGVHENKM